jgi:ABC-type branched-subunit amino acid transport system ATPase component
MLLDVEALTVRFGGVEALSGVGLEVAQGEVLGLVGANGCGKTTLLNAICGVVRPAAGRIGFRGAELIAMPVHDITRLGIARTNQTVRLFPNMTVTDNVAPADGRQAGAAVGDAIERMALSEQRHMLAGALPLAAQRRLEIARALARSPRLMLLDEPASGLNPQETDEMIALLGEHVLPGRAVILIEHKLPVLTALCPRAVLLDQGRVANVSPPAELFAAFVH